ncbi:MAG: hypothetical protein II851_04410 [Bacteroidales bacterium]|nr:hypothetical protein [Bacteroidales bacterium]
MKKSFADIVRETEDDLRQRLQAKVPEWAEVLPELQLPARLNVEQCSSSAAAFYKAGVAASLLPVGGRIADLTGGLGVDAWAFSSVASEVLYNEMDSALCEAVRHNFGLLGVSEAVFRCSEVRPGFVRDILGDFQPSLLYLDPARRSAMGRKVFLLEDCSPDLVALQDELLSICPHVLVKISPMADITLLRRRLPAISEVHVVSVDGECKELLLHLDASGVELFKLIVTELRDGKTHSLCFSDEDRSLPCPGLPADSFGEGDWLFEPGAALMKSECHAAACRRAGLHKLAPSTHLYLGQDPIPELAPFGRFRRILEVLPLDKRTMADVARRYPQAEVTARNIPMTSDELRRRLSLRPGGKFPNLISPHPNDPGTSRCSDTSANPVGPVHFYGVTATVPGSPSRRLLLVTRGV